MKHDDDIPFRVKRPKDTDLSAPANPGVRGPSQDTDDVPYPKSEAENGETTDPERGVNAEPGTGPERSVKAEPGTGPESGGAPQTAKKKRAVSETVMSVLSGNILSRSEVRRAYPYMIFISALAFVYIANIFRTQSTYREYAALTEQVKELRAKSMTIASEKMKATRQSRIMLELERRNIPLIESLTPNKVIPKPERNEEGQVDR